MTFAPGPYPRPEEVEQAVVREWEHEFDAAAERERIGEDARPHHHPVRSFVARFRRTR